MAKEKVKYIDGTEVEIEVFSIGFRKATQIARSHIPINDLTFHKDDSMSIKGDIDFFGLQEDALSTIKDLDLDLLEPEEAKRLYKTYFEKGIMSGLGQGGNPN